MWIKDENFVEKLVKSHSRLIWDGWDIVLLIKSNNPVTHTDARFVNGKWWRTRTFPLTENGWWLPDGISKA